MSNLILMHPDNQSLQMHVHLIKHSYFETK